MLVLCQSKKGKRPRLESFYVVHNQSFVSTGSIELNLLEVVELRG